MLTRRRFIGLTSAVCGVIGVSSTKAIAERFAATEITELPAVINSPGAYCLSKSLSFTQPCGVAIDIQSPNVTLDLNEFSIIRKRETSVTGYIQTIGIRIGAHENVSILNGSVVNFDVGISGGNSSSSYLKSNIAVSSISVLEPRYHGIILSGDETTIKNCTVSQLGKYQNKSIGIGIQGSMALVKNCIVSGECLTAHTSFNQNTIRSGIVISTIGNQAANVEGCTLSNLIGGIVFDYSHQYSNSTFKKYKNNTITNVAVPVVMGTDIGGNLI